MILTSCKTEPVWHPLCPPVVSPRRAKGAGPSPSVFLTVHPRQPEGRFTCSVTRQGRYESVLKLSNDLFKRNLRFLHVQNQNVENREELVVKSQSKRPFRTQKSIDQTIRVPFGVITCQSRTQLHADHPKEARQADKPIRFKKPFRLSSMTETTRQPELSSGSTGQNLILARTSQAKKKPLNISFCDYFYLYKLASTAGNTYATFSQTVRRFPKTGSQLTVAVQRVPRVGAFEEGDHLAFNDDQSRGSKRASKRVSGVGKRGNKSVMNMKIGLKELGFPSIEVDPKDFQTVPSVEIGAKFKEIPELPETLEDLPSQGVMPGEPREDTTSKWMKMIERLLAGGDLNQVGS